MEFSLLVMLLMSMPLQTLVVDLTPEEESDLLTPGQLLLNQVF